MPPTQTDLRPLRPPPQPWVPPYHRASVDRKMKLIRWAFFTFFLLLVLYPSARVLGSSTGSSVLGSSNDAFGSSPDGSVCYIDEFVKQKGNGVEILKPGGGGMVEGILGDGGRGLAARHVAPILEKTVNISNDHVSVKYWVLTSHQDRLPLSAELEELILHYSEKLIVVLKDWSGPRITQILGEGFVDKTDLEWSCKNNLSTCLPPVHKDCFAQLDTITLDFNKQLQEHSVDHSLGMQITLIDEAFLAGESPEMSLTDIYSSLMNWKYSEAYKSKDKRDFQKYVDSNLPEDIEWFLKQQPLWEFSSKDLDAMKRRLEYQMNGTYFFNGSPTFSRAIRSSDQPVQPCQSKNKDYLKGHKGQIDRMIESDGLKLDELVRLYPNNLPWGPARGEAKEEVEETVNGTRTQQFMAPLRKQCVFWADCSIEDMDKIAAQHQARVNRFTPLMQHGSPSKNWSDFDKYIEDSAKSLESAASMIKMTWPIIEKKNWDSKIKIAINQTTAAIENFCSQLDFCNQKDKENAIGNLQAKYQKAIDLLPFQDVGHLTKRADPSWQTWSDFDKDIEGLVKYYHSIAPLWQMGVPGLGKKEWDEQMETLLRQTTEAIGQFCLRLPDCTEKDVENAVQKAETKLRSIKSLIQSRGLEQLSTREISRDIWVVIDASIESLVAQSLGSAKTGQEVMIGSFEGNLKVICRDQLAGCTEQDVATVIQKLRARLQKSTSSPGARATKRDVSKDEWAEFDKQTEVFGKTMDDLARKLATLDRSNLPELGRETFDQQAGDLISANAEHFREKCLGTSGCTEHDVLTMVQSMKDRIQKSSDLIPSPASPPMARDLSSAEWDSVDGRIEAFGKSADNLAQKLATTGDPGARKAFDQTVDEWIRVIDQGTQEQCVAVEGCNDQDLAAITQKMRDRASKFAASIHSREVSIDAFDRSLVEIGTQMDNFARQLNQMGLPGSRRNLFDTVADAMFGVAEKVAHDQCILMGGCDDQFLATRLQKFKDRAQQSADLLHSREVSISLLSRDISKESWALINQIIEKWGQNMDTITQNPAQIGLPELTRKDFEAFLDEQSSSQLKGLGDMCLVIEGCNEQVLATIHQKYKDRAQKSASLLHSRELPAQMISRNISTESWAEMDLIIDAYGKTFDNFVGVAQKVALPNDARKTFDELVANLARPFEKSIQDDCPTVEGCNEQVLATIKQKFRDRIQQSASLLHSRDFPASARRDFPVDQMAANDIFLDEFQKAFGEKMKTESWINVLNWSLPKLNRFEEDIGEECRTNQDAEKELDRLNDKLENALKRPRDVHQDNPEDNFFKEFTAEPLEFDGFHLETTTKIFRAAIQKIRELHAQKVDVHRIREFLEKVQMFETQATADAIIQHCKEPGNCGMGNLQSFVGLWEEESSKFLYSTIPYLLPDDKGSNYPVESSDLPGELSTVGGGIIEVISQSLEAVKPVFRMFYLDKGDVESILEFVAVQAKEAASERCKARKDCTTQDLEEFSADFDLEVEDFLKSLEDHVFRKRSDGLLLPFLDLKGPPSLTEGSIPADKRDSSKKISEIMDSKVFVTREPTKNDTILLWIESLMLTKAEEDPEQCKKLGQNNCGLEFTVVIQAGDNATLPVAHEFTSDNMTAILLWAEKELKDQDDRLDGLCKVMKVNPCISTWVYKVGWQGINNIVLDGNGHQINSKRNIGEVFKTLTEVRDIVEVVNATIEFLHEVPEVVKTLAQLVSELEKPDVIEKQVRFIRKLDEFFLANKTTNDTMPVGQEQELYKGALHILKDILEKSSQLLPTINHRTDDTSTGMKDFQRFAEMDQVVDQGSNQTAIEVDCNVDPTDEHCSPPIPTPDSTPNPNPLKSDTLGDKRLAAFTNWLPFIALFSIISLLLLLLGLKCCTVWSRTRRTVPEESDESPTPIKATSQPLLGPAARPDDEEAQMTQVREPVAPMGLDGASEGWARKWIPNKRGNELKVGKRTSPDLSSPHLLPKPPTRAPRIPSLQLPKAIFHTVRVASGLGSPAETESQKRRVKWGSTL